MANSARLGSFTLSKREYHYINTVLFWIVSHLVVSLVKDPGWGHYLVDPWIRILINHHHQTTSHVLSNNRFKRSV